MNRISIVLISFIAIAALSCSTVLSSKNEWSVSSPDGRLCMILKLDIKTGKIAYSAMMRNGKDTVTLLGSSPLGIILKNQSYMADLDFSHAAEIRTINDEYTLASGKQLVNKAMAKEISVSFKNIYKETITIIMRAYNDGFAFRYYLPKKENTTHIITADLTGFSIPEGSKAWLQPYDKIKKYSPAYEKYYTEVPSGTRAPSAEGWCFPALFEIKDHWILITEADHDGTSPAFHLSPDAEEGTYYLRQPESKEAENTGNNLTTTTLPWKSPWRVIIASDNLNGIVQSQLVNSVARPPSNIDFSWVKPGRSSWSWWTDRSSSRNADKLKSFIDLSFIMGWEYSLVDASWSEIAKDSMQQVIDYANSKNIGLFLWYNSGGNHNSINVQPRNIINDSLKRKKEFARIHRLGIKGVKVDFLLSDKQHIIKLYTDVLRDAADNQLMVNFHGCTIPKGWSRTWPNLMTMEGVKGEEAYIYYPEYPAKAPENNTILAFTRNVVGPMDYTPVAFSDHTYPHLTTNAYELALSVLFESGVIHFADKGEQYISSPYYVLEFLKRAPVAWDSTRFISGYPGKDVVIARKKGNTWYIAGINGEKKQKSFQLNLSFIKNNISSVRIISDGEDGKKFDVADYSGGKNTEPICILPYGGFVATISLK